MPVAEIMEDVAATADAEEAHLTRAKLNAFTTHWWSLCQMFEDPGPIVKGIQKTSPK